MEIIAKGYLSNREYYFLKNLLDDSRNIFMKSNIDRYMKRPNVQFCNGKYSILDDFCYAELLVYYTHEKKSRKAIKYQSDELDHNLIENNHEGCS